jgi:hypothetical protein
MGGAVYSGYAKGGVSGMMQIFFHIFVRRQRYALKGPGPNVFEKHRKQFRRFSVSNSKTLTICANNGVEIQIQNEIQKSKINSRELKSKMSFR